jgi:energy-coupling factor transporter ATP-binding protein EcfA2
MSVLVLDRVTYRFPDAKTPALRDVSVEIEPGEFVVVAGLTGSGKSTFLGAACGLVPHFHGGELSGRVTVAGMDTREHGPGELAGAVGTLLQDPETQVVMGTVRGEIAFPLENRGTGAAAIARGVEEAALALGIAHLIERSTSELSGGELQRVALAAALAGRPELVLLDEPTSQLDPVAGDELVGLLRRLNEEHGTAVVLVEHRLERCLAAADRVLAFEGGSLAFDGTPRAFLEWAPAPLRTPVARLFFEAGLQPPPTGVKEARAALRAQGLTPAGVPPAGPAPRGGRPALRLRNVWHELSGGRAVLRAVDLALAPGDRVALLGRNGAGKSTLLRLAAGLAKPTRGKVETAGRVALLAQHPSAYLVHELVREEAGAESLARVGLTAFADRHPRDLSGGERQLLALAIVTGGEPPVALLLDEPTRGMDRAHKDRLAGFLRTAAAGGTAVLLVTHDAEFAAAVADRAVLLGDGEVIADGGAHELLAGGWYFATETARVLGAKAGVLLPDEGAALLRAGLAEEAVRA